MSLGGRRNGFGGGARYGSLEGFGINIYVFPGRRDRYLIHFVSDLICFLMLQSPRTTSLRQKPLVKYNKYNITDLFSSDPDPRIFLGAIFAEDREVSEAFR
jgi:hypothetical protein